MKLSITHQILAGCAAALLLIALLGQFAYRTADTAASHGALIARTQSVLLYSENLSTQLDRLDRELHQIVGTGIFEPTSGYRTTISALAENLDLLAAYVTPDSQQRAMFDRIRRSIESKVSTLEQEAGSHLDDPGALAALVGASEARTAELHPEIRQLQRTELETLAKTTVTGEFSASKTRYSILLVCGAAIVLFLIGATLMIGDARRQDQVRAGIRRNEARFRTLAARLPVGMFLVDREGRIEFVNDRYTTITGLRREDLEGHPWTGCVHPDDRTIVAQGQADAADRDEEFRTEYRPAGTNGKEGLIRGRFRTLRSEGGTPDGFIGIVSDPGESREAADERDRFFSLSPDLLMTTDTGGTIRQFNPAWTDRMGFNVGELTGASLFALVHEDDLAATEKAWNRLAAGRSLMRFQNRVRTKEGFYRRVSWSASADPDQTLIYAIARDITDAGRTAPHTPAIGDQVRANPSDGAGHAVRILLAGSDGQVAARVVDMLTEQGISSSIASSGAEAVELATSEPFDAIILDFELNDMDGQDLIDIIRTSECNRAIPVVAILEASDRTRIPDLHIQGFVEKPVDLQHLYDAIWRTGIMQTETDVARQRV